MLNLPDPHFDAAAVSSRIINLWFQVINAHLTQDAEPLKPYFSPALYNRLEQSLDRFRLQGVIYSPIRPAVLQCNSISACVSGSQQKLTCTLLSRMIPQVLHDGSPLSTGNRNEVVSNEIWTLCRAADAVTPLPDQAVSVHCTKCGAPLSLYRSAKCPFCSNLVPVPDFNWTVEDIFGAINSLHI